MRPRAQTRRFVVLKKRPKRSGTTFIVFGIVFDTSSGCTHSSAGYAD